MCMCPCTTMTRMFSYVLFSSLSYIFRDRDRDRHLCACSGPSVRNQWGHGQIHLHHHVHANCTLPWVYRTIRARACQTMCKDWPQNKHQAWSLEVFLLLSLGAIYRQAFPSMFPVYRRITWGYSILSLGAVAGGLVLEPAKIPVIFLWFLVMRILKELN